MDTQKCNGCDVTKPLTDFARQKHLKTGFNTICKTCRNVEHADKMKYDPDYPTRKSAKNPKVDTFTEESEGGSGVGFKHCKTCKTDKPKEAFSFLNAAKGTTNSKCKSCRNADRYEKLNADFQAADDHRETVKTKNQAYGRKKKELASPNRSFGELSSGSTLKTAAGVSVPQTGNRNNNTFAYTPTNPNVVASSIQSEKRTVRGPIPKRFSSASSAAIQRPPQSALYPKQSTQSWQEIRQGKTTFTDNFKDRRY